jgi:dTDP-4-amino-4,6-dideoxygalactose transaminase
VIPVSAPKHQYLSHRAEIDAAIARVLESGWYVLGDEVAAFEKEFATYCGVKHAVGVGNGTDALAIAIKGLGIGPGDEVITSVLTAVASVAAIEMAGATPIAIDVDPIYRTLDPELLSVAINAKTKAIIPVHLYGQFADMTAIMKIANEHDLAVIEDCAQATGAMYQNDRAGSVGKAGCFSFYPTKNLGAIGDGGMIITDDPALATAGRQLRQYGWNDDRQSQQSGVNSRLDEIQAAILRSKLKHLDADNDRRRETADIYDGALAGTGLPAPARRDATQHAFHLYVIDTPHRERLRAHLADNGIATGIHYPSPVHLEPVYQNQLGDFARPIAENLCKTVLSLPLYPELTESEVDQVAVALAAFRTE